MIDVLRPDWPVSASVRAAMSLRSGGISLAPYDALNVGAHVGDDPAAVAENRHRLRDALDLPAEPAWLEQVHGTAVADLDAAITRTAAPVGPNATAHSTDAVRANAAARNTVPIRADAAVTRNSGHVCAIQVADCMPVLFATADGSAIGAAHAGWRGLAGGVLEATVMAMRADPAHLFAWLGPAISQKRFEVGDEVRAAFLDGNPKAAAAFTQNARQRWQCDLYALARLRLAALGVRHISGGDWCTHDDRSRFFSFRRDGRCGRMAALIWLSSS
jgi:polyphenol oxidase